MPRLLDRAAGPGRPDPAAVRFLLSAHASHAELFLFRRLTEELMGEAPKPPSRSKLAGHAERSSRSTPRSGAGG
jgi:hypothetical protein